MSNQPEKTALTGVTEDKAALDYGRQPLPSVDHLPPNHDLPALKNPDNPPALEGQLPKEEQQDKASPSISSSAKHSVEKARTLKREGGTPRSTRSSKDTQGSAKGGSAKGSAAGTSGSTMGSKGGQVEGHLPQGEQQDKASPPISSSAKHSGEKPTTPKRDGGIPRSTRNSKDTQEGSAKASATSGSTMGSKGGQGSLKGGKIVTGSTRGSKGAMDSIKGTKGTKSETDSRNAVESDKDKSRSDSKETQEAPLKSPMAVTFDEVPLDKHEPAPTPPPPAKPDRSNLVIIGVAVVFVAIVFLLILTMLTRGGLERKSSVTTATCTSEHCVRVAKLLLESIAPDVNPCENFYLHICGGWKYAGSLGEVLFQKLVDDVTFLIRTVNVPATGQSPSEKAALAYKACEDIVAKNNTNLTTLLQILEEAGFYSPPGWTGSVDALNATFYLHFRWRIAAPMKFTYVRHTDQGITLRMAPSESLKAYARRRKKPGYYDDLRKDYEMFQTTFEQNKLPNLTYDDWKKIDETVIADSEEALQEANSIINFAGWNESTIQNAIRGVSRQHWASILDTYLNRSDALRFYVDSLFLFKKFMEMPHDVGNAVAQAYYRWYMAEVLTRRVYAPWIVKDFPSFDDALKYHRGYCFAIVEQSASFALLAPYVQHAFHKAVKDDIKRLLQMVRGAYNDVFAEGVEMRSGVDMLPTYTNGTGHLFDRLTLSDEKYLKESYAAYEDMTSDPLQNWRRLMIGRSRTLWTRVSMGVAGVLPAEMLYYEIDGVSNDIILRPDMAVVPAYDSGAPLLLKLASLGSLMASAMAKVLYGTQETTARWHATAHCIFRKQEPGNATGGKIVVLQRVIALAVTVLAAMKATKDDEPLTLPGIPDISGMQLLFALWCYQQCGEKEGERLCNEPLKEIGVFANVFKCGANSMMRRDHACSVAWFKPLKLANATSAGTTVSDTQPDNGTNTGDSTQPRDTPLLLRVR